MKPGNVHYRRSGLALIMLASCLQLACKEPVVADTARPAAIAQPAPASPNINPLNWPLQAAVMPPDPATEERVAQLLGRMSLEEKVGQVIQADINSITPMEAAEFNLGSVLNGGGSAPGGDNRTTPDRWLALADEFWLASTDITDGGVGIPLLWGTDAVHGHSNILGATIFPHNIGLGMANDPDLVYDIGRVTAIEMRVTGLDWTFAPTIAVARNDRWGRTYESYSESPELVANYAPRIIEGLQGRLGTPEFLDADHMMATAKHFVGDGGTVDGLDQGDTISSEAELRDIQAAGYPPAIAAGVQSVMASFNSFHGRKMHGYTELLSDVLVGRMGFDGFVVGDWNGHGQVEGCTNESCAASLNAGVDMFMAPDSWRGLYASTLAQVRSGEISMERLDQAVSRVLRAKFRAGTFEAGMPSTRRHAGNYELLGSPAHRAVAREAVRKSLVLLKNESQLLPLQPGMQVLLAGDGAHNIGKQSGGWTLNWQGTDNRNEHFPNGESIYEGLKAALESIGGSVKLSEDGRYTDRPDVAVLVYGEDPYAEFQGDRASVDFEPEVSLKLLRELRAQGIPTVSVFLSGRPMWVNPELNASDAFVAAWLPGTEGGGVADVLVADAEGNPRHDFQGRLSFSWPRTATQVEVNIGDEDYDPLFPFGYGLSYARGGPVAVLPEDSGLGDTPAETGFFLEFGDPQGALKWVLSDAGGDARINDSRGRSPEGRVQIQAADRAVQEDSVIINWTGKGGARLEGPVRNLEGETNGDMVLEIEFRVLEAPTGPVMLALGRGHDWRANLEVTAEFAAAASEGWQTSQIKLSCFRDQGALMHSISEPLVVTADAPLRLQLATVRVAANPGNAGCLQ